MAELLKLYNKYRDSDYVLKDGDKLIAFAKVVNRSLPDRQVIGIFNVEVVPDLRDRGYGTELLTKLVAALKQRDDIRTLWLYVSRNNLKAIHIYKKVGFKITGESGGTYEMEQSW